MDRLCLGNDDHKQGLRRRAPRSDRSLRDQPNRGRRWPGPSTRTGLHPILPRIIFAVGTRTNVIEPVAVIAVPINRFPESAFPCFPRTPVELTFDDGGIDRIT